MGMQAHMERRTGQELQNDIEDEVKGRFRSGPGKRATSHLEVINGGLRFKEGDSPWLSSLTRKEQVFNSLNATSTGYQPPPHIMNAGDSQFNHQGVHQVYGPMVYHAHGVYVGNVYLGNGDVQGFEEKETPSSSPAYEELLEYTVARIEQAFYDD